MLFLFVLLNDEHEGKLNDTATLNVLKMSQQISSWRNVYNEFDIKLMRWIVCESGLSDSIPE